MFIPIKTVIRNLSIFLFHVPSITKEFLTYGSLVQVEKLRIELQIFNIREKIVSRQDGMG